MLGIPVILMLEISYQRRRVLIDFVYDTNHWLAVINQPKSICNIVFYHINVMVMNVFVRIFHLGGGGVEMLGRQYYNAIINTSGSISEKFLTMDETGRG